MNPAVTVFPADTPSGKPFVSSSGIRVSRYSAGLRSVSGAEAVTQLLGLRAGIVDIARCEIRIAGIEGSGAQRTLLIHSRVAGTSGPNARRQIESWWSCRVVRRPDRSADWVLASATETGRTVVESDSPIFQKIHPGNDGRDWKAGSDRPADFRNVASPGDHDTGGVAVVERCRGESPCLVFGGGSGLAVLVVEPAGSLIDFTQSIGLGGHWGEAKSILSSDFDNDGIPDLFVSYDQARCRFFRGRRETAADAADHLVFDDMTSESGLGNLTGAYRSAVALDADRDGRLDLYLVQYGDGSRTGPSISGRNGRPNKFFRNITPPGGAIRFTDESHSSATDDTGWGLAAGAADYDGDGRVDLYVANDFGPNVLYRNVTKPGGPIQFRDVTGETGTADLGFGMGVAWGDFDGDGDLDLHVTNYWMDERWIILDPRFPLPPIPLSSLVGSYARRRLQDYALGDSLFRNDVRTTGRFARVSREAGVSDGGWAWGTVFVDADGDGWPDIAVANGMLLGRHGANHDIDFWNETSAGWTDFSSGRWKIDFHEDGITGPQDERLFLNLHDGTFVDIAYASGFDTNADLRGLVAADIDGDGAPDLVGGAFLASPEIYRNVSPGWRNSLRIRLVGRSSNRDAVGAVARLTTDGHVQTRPVTAGGSFLSDSGRLLVFAVGPEHPPEKVEIRWPTGRTSVIDRPTPSAQILEILEPPD